MTRANLVACCAFAAFSSKTCKHNTQSSSSCQLVSCCPNNKQTHPTIKPKLASKLSGFAAHIVIIIVVLIVVVVCSETASTNSSTFVNIVNSNGIVTSLNESLNLILKQHQISSDEQNLIVLAQKVVTLHRRQVAVTDSPLIIIDHVQSSSSANVNQNLNQTQTQTQTQTQAHAHTQMPTSDIAAKVDSMPLTANAKVALLLLGALCSVTLAATFVDVYTSCKSKKHKYLPINQSVTQQSDSPCKFLAHKELAACDLLPAIAEKPHDSSVQLISSGQPQQHLAPPTTFTANEFVSDTSFEPNCSVTTLRDERSSSVSSCSSSFSVSINSVRSASSPILGFRAHLGAYCLPTGHQAELQAQAQSPQSHQSQNQNVHNPKKYYATCGDANFLRLVRNKRQPSQSQDTSAWHRRPLPVASCALQQQQQQQQQLQHQVQLQLKQANGQQNKLALRLLLAFSLRQSAIQVFGSRGAPSDFQRATATRSIDGLRFLSMVWIIAVHTYSFAQRWLTFAESPRELSITMYSSMASQLLANGTFACDTFLFIGGFLVAYCALYEHKMSTLKLKVKQANNKCGLGKALGFVLGKLVHRYVRMAPLMMAIIALSATFLRYFGSGLAWQTSTVMFDEWCRDNWWTNALFVHNFIGRERMCLSHSWYSAVDMQLFVVAQLTLALIMVFKREKLAIVALLAFVLIAQLCTGILTFAHQLPAVPLMSPSSNLSRSVLNIYFAEIYIKPYCRASPYLIGFLLAYSMINTRLSSFKLSKFKSFLAILLSVTCMAFIVLSMRPTILGLTQQTSIQSTLYSTLSRPLWALCVGLIVFACASNQCACVQQILGSPLIEPLAKLTYPAFLVHPIVIATFYGARNDMTFAFSHYLMLYLILGNLVITYAVSFVLACLFELPIQRIERELKQLKHPTTN